MRSRSLISRAARVVCINGALFVAAILPAMGQDLAQLDQRPRFLRESGAGQPRTMLDLNRTPMLLRRISLDSHERTLRELLAAIGKQARLELVYSADLLPVDRPMRFRADSITVAAALTEVLIGAGVDVVFYTPTQAGLVRRGDSRSARAGAIAGRVTDVKTGHAISGAEVLLNDARWRTTTDTTGWYRLADVDPGTYTLTIRRLGYAKQHRQVTVLAEQEDTVNLALAAVAVKLDELVTTATGQQRRRDIGNAITTINADSVLRNAPIRNLTDLLENRVPGLTVQRTSGAPGDPAKLRLRGLGSALRSNDPVVIVDGVRIYAAQSETRSGNLTNQLNSVSLIGDTVIAATHITVTPNKLSDAPAPSPLDQIDPNIIETIEVFKGPSAATLYGADAANGVIVITTRRGRPGPTRWDASMTLGRTTSPGQYPVGYFRWGHDDRTGTAPLFCTLRDVFCVQDSLVRFQALNDPDLTILGHGRRTGLSLTASGGTQALTYSVTGSYANEMGLLTMPTFEVERFRTVFNKDAPDWMRRPHHLETWNVTSNVLARLSSSADVTLSTTLGRSEQLRTSLEEQLAPLAGTYVDRVSGLYYRPSVLNAGNVGESDQYLLNATSTILSNYYVKRTASTITFTTGLNATWRPHAWFNLTGQAGLNVIPRDDHLLLPAGLVSATDSGAVVRGIGRSLVSTFGLQGEVRKSLGRGFVFTTSVGANLKTENTSDLASSATGLLPGTSSLSGARSISASELANNTSVYGWYIEPRFSGQRLSLSTGLRLDGGSTYGTRVTTGGVGLPKLNGSWVVSEESWFPFRTVFTSLRLRGAYGQAQVQPGVADRLRLYNDVTFGSALLLSNLGNTQLRPERSTEFEGGFDADLLDNRISVELSAYRKLQVDALMSMTLPGSVGGGSVLQNIGNIRNTGLDLVFRLTPVRLPALTWSAALIYNNNTNTLVKLGRGVAPNKAEGLVEGYPVRSRWARPILGFADQNADGAIQPEEIQVGDSLVFMGRLYPAYETSLSTDVVLFGGAVGVSAGFSYNSGALQVDETARTNWVLSRALIDPSVPLSEQAAVWASTRKIDPTDYGLMQEVSTFRFNSLSVNYRAPARVARLLRAQQMSVAVQGSNLGLHSTYHGKDPDVNAWSPGENIVDTGQLPQPRTWQIRVGVTY